MRRETCCWMSIFCIFALWMGGIVYFVLDMRQTLLLDMKQDLASVLQHVEKLSSAGASFNNKLSDTSIKAEKVISLVEQMKASMPPKTVIVNKDGCIPQECLARVLLIVWDLRRSFALGAMSSDTVRAVKPMLAELRDREIDESLQVLENFTHRKGYREIKEELGAIKKSLHFGHNGPVRKYLSKWISIENHNDRVWQDFVSLENLVDSGAWTDALELIGNSELKSVPRVQLWMRDLEFVLSVEGHLALIYNKLIERVNRNPEGI